MMSIDWQIGIVPGTHWQLEFVLLGFRVIQLKLVGSFNHLENVEILMSRKTSTHQIKIACNISECRCILLVISSK